MAREISRSVAASRIAFDSAAPRDLLRSVPVEHPVNIIYGNVPYAVMMATPADLEDFAIGFSLTEGIIEKADEIRRVTVEDGDKGALVTVELTPGRFRQHLARGRNLAGRTGCGVCGVEKLDDLPEAGRVSGIAASISRNAISAAVRALDEHQPLNDITHAVHGAAWCAADGAILQVREDVGRHNALDKLIGALLRGGVDPAEGFLLITSRCSFEMVEKTARFGARLLVAVSAPTSLALERARALGVGVVAIARRDGALDFTNYLSAEPVRTVA